MAKTITEKTLTDLLKKTRISDDMREALRLVVVEGKSAAEASELTGVSQTKIYVRKRTLNELLAKDGLRQITLIYPDRLQGEIDRVELKINKALEKQGANDPHPPARAARAISKKASAPASKAAGAAKVAPAKPRTKR